jgi:hypothetical protein
MDPALHAELNKSVSQDRNVKGKCPVIQFIDEFLYKLLFSDGSMNALRLLPSKRGEEGDPMRQHWGR